ncbi:hypothetical protein TNCV_1477651 [Trichonephila clavipes]|nr:hypothetical protein TNCV_1477651 [Trichonephila clavipes]
MEMWWGMITVDYLLEVSTQPKNERIQVGKSRRRSCSKMPADGSVVIEMAEEHLFRTTCVLWRKTILNKHCGCLTSPCLNSVNNGLLYVYGICIL